VKKVKLLIDEGENAVTKIGETSLHIAAFKGNVAIAELLIEKGAFVNTRKITNEILLHRAAHCENLKTASTESRGRNRTPGNVVLGRVRHPETVRRAETVVIRAIHEYKIGSVT
jgi:ankyrin repeat protein